MSKTQEFLIYIRLRIDGNDDSHPSKDITEAGARRLMRNIIRDGTDTLPAYVSVEMTECIETKPTPKS